VFTLAFHCVGKHDRNAVPLLVFVQAEAKETGEILRSMPFILCASRDEKTLQTTFQKMKTELVAATLALKSIKSMPEPLPSPTPITRLAPEHPPQRLNSQGDESALSLGGPLEETYTPSDSHFAFLDYFRGSRFAN